MGHIWDITRREIHVHKVQMLAQLAFSIQKYFAQKLHFF